MENIEIVLKENLEKIKKHRNIYQTNEQAVRTQLIEPILNKLGWDISNPNFVKLNIPTEDGKIPDYILIKEKKELIVIEAKNLSVEIKNEKILNQIASYCYKPGIEFGILTNGAKWLLFDTFEKNPQNRIVWQVDLEKDEISYIVKHLQTFSYSNIDTLSTLVKEKKTLNEIWNSFIKSDDDIYEIITTELMKKIRQNKPPVKVDPLRLKNFIQNKIKEVIKRTIEEEKEVSTSEQSSETSKKVTRFSVTFPNGKVIREPYARLTFLKTIEHIGIEKILPLKLKYLGKDLISEEKYEKKDYQQRQMVSIGFRLPLLQEKKLRFLRKLVRN